MSMFTRKMQMLTAVVLDADSDAVVKALLEMGVMDFVHINSLQTDKISQLKGHQSSMPKATLSDLRTRVEALLRQGGIPFPSLEKESVDAMPKLDLDEYRRRVDRITGALQEKKNSQKDINQKLLLLSELSSYVVDGKTDYIDLRVGNITHGNIGALEGRISPLGGVFISGEPCISLTLRRDSSRLSPIMDKFGWTEIGEVSIQKASYEKAKIELSVQYKALEESLATLSKEVQAKVLESKDELVEMWLNLRLHELCEHVESFFSYTKNTTLFSGWVPFDNAREVEKAITAVTKGSCIIEWTDDSEVPRDDVPVSMTSPKALKPFERLIENYNVPEYGSINPTPFTAIAYVLMFMLMFADFGQGLLLLLTGILGSSYYKKHPLAKDGLISRYLCSLLLYLGPAAMVGGILFGSYFGYSLFPALWFNLHSVVNGHGGNRFANDVYDVLGITIKFGIGIIYTGLILNWINLARKKRYLELLFDKNGILGGWLYALGIWACYYFVGTGYKSFPSSPLLTYGVLIPLVVLMAKGPAYQAYNRKHGGKCEKGGQLVVDCIMDFLVEVLEIFTGFLSNTLSFMRVAGLGIAHVSLMTAFEDMSSLPGNIIAAVLIMVAGNLLVTVLEGLSAGIQALRLNYYEFFTKYFTGHGVSYAPVGLKSRITIV